MKAGLLKCDLNLKVLIPEPVCKKGIVVIEIISSILISLMSLVDLRIKYESIIFICPDTPNSLLSLLNIFHICKC